MKKLKPYIYILALFSLPMLFTPFLRRLQRESAKSLTQPARPQAPPADSITARPATAIALHAASGDIDPATLPDSLAAAYKAALYQALELGAAMLDRGDSAHTVAQAVVATLERAPAIAALPKRRGHTGAATRLAIGKKGQRGGPGGPAAPASLHAAPGCAALDRHGNLAAASAAAAPAGYDIWADTTTCAVTLAATGKTSCAAHQVASRARHGRQNLAAAIEAAGAAGVAVDTRGQTAAAGAAACLMHAWRDASGQKGLALTPIKP